MHDQKALGKAPTETWNTITSGTQPSAPGLRQDFAQATNETLATAPGSSWENPCLARSIQEAAEMRKGHAFDQGPFVKLADSYEIGGNMPRDTNNLTRIHFNRAAMDNHPNLEGRDLRGSILDGVRFRNLKMTRCDLRGASLAEADFNQAEIADSDFSGADMRKINLSEAFLERNNFHNASLIEANLSKARLRRKGPTTLDMEKANLWSARLAGFMILEARLHDPVKMLGAVRVSPTPPAAQ